MGALTGSIPLAGITLTDLGPLTNTGTLSGPGTLIVDPATITNSGSIGLTVTLVGGSYFYNQVTGTVAVAGIAVYGTLGAPTVVNAGTIAGTGTSGYGILLSAGGSVGNTGLIEGGYAGVELLAGGSVGNTGLIEGGFDGVDLFNAAGTLANSGTIIGTSGSGVELITGGSVGNTGLIEGGFAGVYIFNTAGTVANSGTIAGTSTAGVGVSLAAGSTLTNAGTITGSGGTAVAFSGGGNRLIADPGAVFNGIVNGGTGGDTLELASAASIGTIGGLGTNFTGFDTVAVDAGATWLLTGTNTLGVTTTLTNGGTLEVAGTLANSGTIHGTAAYAPGVYLLGGGSLSNNGLIDGTNGGVYGYGGASSLTNSGTIASTGAFYDGVYLGFGGTVTNTGSIHGLDGVDLRNSGTVTNSGIITGTGYYNVGGIFLGFNYTGGSFLVTNTGTVSSTAVGILMRGAGSIVNGATSATAAVISGSVGLAIFGAGTVTNYGTITGTAGTAISLGSGYDLVVVEPGSKLQGAIAGFRPGDTIDMVGLIANGDTYTGGVLTLTNNGTVESQLTLSTTTVNPTFPLTSDGHGGTLITEFSSPPPPPPPVTYSISPNPASGDENAGSLTVTVTGSYWSAAATVYASTVQDQGFTNSGDYTDLTDQAVSFAAGVLTAQVSVAITDTGATSGSEVFRLIVQQNASDPVSTYLATDNFTIVNSDLSPPPPPPPPVTYSISPSPASVNENAGLLTFTVTRSDSSAAATVYASTVQDQGFTNSGDYTDLTDQVVNFAAGALTAQVSVAITDTGATSGSEMFRLIVQQNVSDPVSTYLATDNFTDRQQRSAAFSTAATATAATASASDLFDLTEPGDRRRHRRPADLHDHALRFERAGGRSCQHG